MALPIWMILRIESMFTISVCIVEQSAKGVNHNLMALPDPMATRKDLLERNLMRSRTMFLLDKVM